MRVVMRADASITTGTGHVMRCLTLAHELRRRGASVEFICREQPGDLCELITAQAFNVTRLPQSSMPAHGEVWRWDAEGTRRAIQAQAKRTDWLVVDHYSLDERWERELRGSVDRVLVVDDLANRTHECDVLLDQNYRNPLHERYRSLVPSGARLLLGPSYGLVRSEFPERREAALARRDGRVRRILVTMGGTDPENDTADVLEGISSRVPESTAIDVVVGGGNPHREQIRGRCEGLANCRLHVQTSQMAELMTQADLAITAGGSTTWERCVLGLPALVTIQSVDQVAIATAMQEAGAQRIVGRSPDLSAGDYGDALAQLTPDAIVGMSLASAQVCDGRGVQRVATELLEWGAGSINA